MEVKIVINADRIVAFWGRCLASRKFRIGAVLTAGFIPLVVYAANVTTPNSFTDGTVISAASVNANFDALATAVNNNAATYRWATFSTYNEATNWVDNNDAAMYGGVAPSSWTDGSALASSISSDKEVQRTLFVNKGYAKKNASIMSETYMQVSSTNGKVAMALFRVKNSSSSAITWTPNWWYTAYSGWSESASVALNGSNVFSSGGGSSFYQGTVNLSIPANRTSTVIFVSTSSAPYTGYSSYGTYIRTCLLQFYNNTLALPTGLTFIDDLDTAAGDYSQ